MKDKVRFVDTGRRWKFYIMFFSLLLDAWAGKGETLMHLTIWSWIFHTIYFELPLMALANTNVWPLSELIPWIHGPSFGGSFALLLCYIWTLAVNPSMEFDLAPPGRAPWLVYVRAFFFHFVPVLFHIDDLKSHSQLLKIRYLRTLSNSSQPMRIFFLFWSSVGGYLAMGLTWEQLAGDSAAAIYNVTLVSVETFTNVSKGLAILGCLSAFFGFLKPKLL